MQISNIVEFLLIIATQVTFSQVNSLKCFRQLNYVQIVLMALVTVVDVIALVLLEEVTTSDELQLKFIHLYQIITILQPVYNLVSVQYQCKQINKTYEFEETEVRQIYQQEKLKTNKVIAIDYINRPMISLLFQEEDMKNQSNGSYINFLIHLYTKVMLNSGWYSDSDLTNDFLLPNSQQLDAYIHYSCWTLGHLILKNILIKIAKQSQMEESSIFDIEKLKKIHDKAQEGDNNEEVFSCLLDVNIQLFIRELNKFLEGLRQVEFLELMLKQASTAGLEVSSYNDNFQKFNTINNSQLQRQVKKQIIANSKQREEKRHRLQKKKLLQLAVEHIPDMVKIDCIEDPQIYFIEFQIENCCTGNKDLLSKQQKAKYSGSLNGSVNNSLMNSVNNSVAIDHDEKLESKFE